MPGGRTGTLITLALLAVAALGAPVAAYETFGEATWRNSTTRFRVNGNFPDTARNGSPDDQVELIHSAANAWENQSSAEWSFSYDGTTTKAGVDLSDSVNAISWVDENADGALAATFLRINDDNGRILKFDMVFYDRTNGEKNNWSGPGEPSGDEIDLVGVAVHEFGHALGLDHSNDVNATMFRSLTTEGLHLRTLADDDLAGLHFLYGSGRPDANPSPFISLVSPDIGSAVGGDEVLIRGRNFTWTTNTTLRIDGVELSRTRYDVDGLETIRVHSMPPGEVGPATISVDNNLGFIALANAYRYGQPPPELVAVEPSVGPLEGGIPVTIRGHYMTGDAEVTIGGSPLGSPAFVDDQTITGVLPPSSSTGLVAVELAQDEDEATLVDGFEYTTRRLEIIDTDVPAGASGFPVEVRATFDDELAGVSFGLVYDGARVTIDDVVVNGTAAEGAAFAAPNIDNDAGITTFGIVTAFVQPGLTIPASDDGVAVTRVLVSPDESLALGETIDIELADSVGSPPVELFFTPAGSSAKLVPHAVHGTLTVAEGLFIRGDVDGNFQMNLTDAVVLLDALFHAQPFGPCDDASDTNDDGRLDVSDAVRILVALFAGGEAPLAPFPSPGIDPTADSLDC